MVKSISSLAPSPLFSIIIPARNEEKHLPSCVHALKASLAKTEEPYEIIVVVNRSEDLTKEIALNEGCVVIDNNSKNLSNIRNSGVQAAKSEYVVTVDADSVVSENMFIELAKELRKEDVIGGGVLILPSRWSLGILLTSLVLLPIVLWYRISAGLFFFKKSSFDQIGGFDENLCSVEDIDLAKRLKQHGKKNGMKFKNLLRVHIRTSMRKFDTFGDWYFLLRPHVFYKLLKGKDQKLSDKVWYDYHDN